MTAIPVLLDSFSWPTKGAAESAFRTILRDSGYDVYDPVSDPEHDLMLRELLARHPNADEKTGAGVDYFFIGRTSDGDKFNVRADAIGIWIKRIDGTEVDFSYLTAIRNHTPESDAKEGLRIAVDGQRMEYRAQRFLAGRTDSDISGNPIPMRDLAQVIYLAPTWNQLTTAFSDAVGGWNAIEVESGHGAVKIGSH